MKNGIIIHYLYGHLVLNTLYKGYFALIVE